MDEVHFNHYLPYSDNSSYDIVLNVQLPPASIERITITIMSEGNTYEVWGDQEEMQPPVSDYSSQDIGTMQKALPAWERIADRDASDDIDQIRELQEDSHFVIFEEKLFKRRIKSLAREVTDDYLKDPSVSLGHEELREAYEKAYLCTFERKKHLVQEQLIEIKDEREKKLRVKLSNDRLLVQNRARLGGWHARDLVLVRMLQIYYPDSLEDIDISNMLLEQYTLIDRYEKFVCDFEGRNEVNWPDPNSFPHPVTLLL